MRLVLDPGHGGPDPVSVAHGLRGADLALEPALGAALLADAEFRGRLAKEIAWAMASALGKV